ncbi:hypothetical protein [Pseudonocardia asaccharolytica]|uniref:hypothetical protein n=1 Tax=Pseudonocardia asaccharolytica TaxID=54010 RepID=UPI001377B0AF|nr:hypothetical protein [Pseudonocardia asaccharolytica]
MTDGASPPRPPWRRAPGRSAVALGLGVLAVALWVLVPEVRHQLRFSFSAQPSGYSELYFTGGAAVPTGSPAGRPQVGVDFVIANHGEGSEPYTYRVRALDAAGAPVAENTGTLPVDDGARRAVHVTLDLPAAARWAVVKVSLVGRPESIHYAAPDAGPGGR